MLDNLTVVDSVGGGRPTQMTFNFRLAPEPQLENFVVDSNDTPFAATKELLKGKIQQLLLYGEPGTGKSHLLLAAQCAWQDQGVTVIAASAALHLGAWPDVDRIAEGSALVVDDVDQLDRAKQRALFVLFNTIRDTGGWMLFAARSVTSQLPVDDDLRTRLAWGVSFGLTPMSEASKVKVLCIHAGARGWLLSAEIAQQLLNRHPRDLGVLVGLIDELDKFALEEKRVLTLALYRRWLKIYHPQLLR